ncbi:hypothetical protein CGMCC3_g15214 [Colletotrichum fructicola]|nr:uncharacterized protein CGMCC3_g15214 [Colletotrichum fructicola]KAE9568642.1 hypothetical protein CGMCC3_g15214 [Colletotrichum fructicola]
MKYPAFLLALVAVTEAAHCNAGWDKPEGASCSLNQPKTYCCEEPGNKTETFPTRRVCHSPYNGEESILVKCLSSGIVLCVSYTSSKLGAILTFIVVPVMDNWPKNCNQLYFMFKNLESILTSVWHLLMEGGKQVVHVYSMF